MFSRFVQFALFVMIVFALTYGYNKPVWGVYQLDERVQNASYGQSW